MEILIDWIVFVLVVLLMIYVINPLLAIILWLAGGG
jgi:hypothetical protein